ncbi:CsbD family protein [Enemella evansiae]|uniref:CsbD family protein n=1 Tax=Enemella evansiae TaxID=2016499 RepID=A0A255GFT3_9ACTN|nr:CsbD family protein [Enemella evansiae]PFG68456.1 CsbD-like protein [Propionibacteriaceae bacterium ES.041]OYN95508.1 CsbD family protein [Enemella evansiae]OYO01640.1 CsbD family protein [Enemella evansiae]OYO03615.1 CsbD family protein [Enemella evansiae]OYO10040.1 CsbD family protein [Enemella evansiae]
MGLGDKMQNAADKAGGKIKEGAGKATGNERLEAEGKADQAKGGMKQAGENIKDAGKDVTR